VARTAALLLSLAASSAAAAEWEGQARLWVGPGFDSNPRRDYLSAGASTAPDFDLYGLGQLGGALRVGERFTALGSYEVGGRAFLQQAGEDTLLQNAQLVLRVRATPWLVVGLTGRGRDRRGADRDYTDLTGGLTLDFVPDEHLEVGLELDAHRFLYWSRFDVSYFGPEATLSARYRFDRRHALRLFGTFFPQTYNAIALRAPAPPDGLPLPTGHLRADTCLGAGVSYAYRGPFNLSAGYAYLDEASNSYGQTLRRHRLSLAGGVVLPWQLTLLAQGTLQLTQYPDGVYLSPELTVAMDDESSSSAVVKLSRPLSAHVELDVRYAFYFNQLPASQFVYQRHVLSLGVAVAY
jgi:hypothetical protein